MGDVYNLAPRYLLLGLLCGAILARVHHGASLRTFFYSSFSAASQRATPRSDYLSLPRAFSRSLPPPPSSHAPDALHTHGAAGSSFPRVSASAKGWRKRRESRQRREWRSHATSAGPQTHWEATPPLLESDELLHFTPSLRPLLSVDLAHLTRDSPSYAPAPPAASEARCTRGRGRLDVYTGRCQCRTGWGGPTCDEPLPQVRPCQSLC
eukprot:scaffold161338_cov31-Tisochrysis_lutea.AAC.6